MKYSIYALLLAATSAIAAPSPAKRDGGFRLINLRARRSLDHTMSFTLIDTTTVSKIPWDCNLIWPQNSAPDQNAACGPNGDYLVQFPDGFTDIGHFTMAIERTGASPIGGRAYLDENDGKWECLETPEGLVKKDCRYEGIYEIGL
ncbi:hypothetical protein AJ79_01932 [Helicocarpus griseus UAMH5409]|uniref:AA1-like domain-containing protein n=1 Tax=Helicocarpus griseus UAMH5409 TaxID=1447875 RepID=A0A2B7Y4P8_9EURO|nr:hypothetical protein AJ79_01932 [Helicocarpus griseus UAMH5409]